MDVLDRVLNHVQLDVSRIVQVNVLAVQDNVLHHVVQNVLALVLVRVLEDVLTVV